MWWSYPRPLPVASWQVWRSLVVSRSFPGWRLRECHPACRPGCRRCPLVAFFGEQKFPPRLGGWVCCLLVFLCLTESYKQKLCDARGEIAHQKGWGGNQFIPWKIRFDRNDYDEKLNTFLSHFRCRSLWDNLIFLRNATMAIERMFWEVPVYSGRNVTTVATLSPYHLAFPDFSLFWRIRRTRDFCHKILFFVWQTWPFQLLVFCRLGSFHWEWQTWQHS